MPDTPLTLRSDAAYDAVLLDLDGTLMDTIPDLAHAANAMRTELGLAALPEALIATFVGNGIDNLIRRTIAHDHAAEALTTELLARAKQAFYPAYHRINGTRSVLFDGVIDGLDAMRSAGLKIAVVTNKSTEFTLPLLELAGLSPYLDAVVCGDTLPERKPDPAPMLHACALLGVAPARSVAVGDSVNDALSARAAGCAVLAVPYGYNHGNSVQTLDVDAIVGSIEVAARWILADGRLPDQSNP
jgi:phosphoglycolate phosphatase